MALVIYRVPLKLSKAIQALKNLPKSSHRLLLQYLETKIGVPLALVRVDRDEEDGEAACDYYFCSFADYSCRPYDIEELLAVPAYDQ